MGVTCWGEANGWCKFIKKNETKTEWHWPRLPYYGCHWTLGEWHKIALWSPSKTFADPLRNVKRPFEVKLANKVGEIIVSTKQFTIDFKGRHTCIHPRSFSATFSLWNQHHERIHFCLPNLFSKDLGLIEREAAKANDLQGCCYSGIFRMLAQFGNIHNPLGLFPRFFCVPLNSLKCE